MPLGRFCLCRYRKSGAKGIGHRKVSDVKPRGYRPGNEKGPFEIKGWGLGETAPVELEELEEFEEVEEAEEIEEVEVEEVVEVDVGTAKVVPSLAGVPGGNKGSAPGNGTT